MFRSLRDAMRLGTATSALGALGFAWELLCRQAPSSPWHIRGIPAAVERFSLRAWVIGLAILVVAPRAWSGGLADDSRRARGVLASAHLGTLFVLASMGISAATGNLAMQIRDGDAFSHALLALRIVGDALLVVAAASSFRALRSSDARS